MNTGYVNGVLRHYKEWTVNYAVMADSTITKPEKRPMKFNQEPRVRIRTGILTTCRYCGVQGSGGNMARYHNENCRKLKTV